MRKPLCIAPFMGLRISADGHINPCCWMRRMRNVKTSTMKIDQYWNSGEVRALRAKMFKDKLPTICSRCTTVGDNIDYKRIQFYNDVMDDNKDINDEWVVDQPFKIRQMDMNFSNKCNLKCRHCGPWNSTSWMKDYQKLREVQSDLTSDYYKVNVGNNSFIHDREVFEHVRKIDFKGGEPMMQEEMYILLENLVKWDLAKNIRITYITNGTKPSKHLHSLWKHFRKINISLSVEATGELFEYVRGGNTLTWGQFNDSLKEYASLDFITSVGLSHTLMNFTLFNTPSTLEWLAESSSKYKLKSKKVTVDDKTWDNMVTNPPYLNINVLPKALKLKVIKMNKQTGYKALIPITNALIQSLGKSETRYWNQFKTYTKTLDKIRNESLGSIVPEFKDYIE